MHNLVLHYIADFCIPVASIAANSLRSATAGHLIVPRTHTKFEEICFQVAGSSAWSKTFDRLIVLQLSNDC